jgi:cell division protein ZipA
MNTLFLILLIIVIVGIAIWRYKVNQSAKGDMARRLNRDLYTDDYFDDNLLEQTQAERTIPMFQSPNEAFPEPLHEADTMVVDPFDDMPKNEVPKNQADSSQQQTELMVVLYVVAQQDSFFSGMELIKMLEALGLKYGKFDIFHHYGVGALKSDKPVFSVANLVEPGTLNPEEMFDLSTPGLAFFMRLPGPFGGRIALELMLKNAKELAESLGGTLQDEVYTPLDNNKINAMRERIAAFEQRSGNLSSPQKLSL